MPNWKQLEKDLSNWLYTFARENIEFRNPYQAIIGFPYDGFRSDGMLTDGNILIAIEVEAGQMHPDTNVGKYWLLSTEYKYYAKISLFHIYTPDFDSYKRRKELAEFYVKKMCLEVPVDYVILDYRNATDYDATLSEIKSTIKKRVEQEFKQE